jgi:hypothetical protein
MENEVPQNLLQNLCDQQSKVTIWTLDGGRRTGYIEEVGNDYISMKSEIDSEILSALIPFKYITAVDIEQNLEE